MRIAGFDLETSSLNGDFGIVLCCCVKELGKRIKTFRIDDYKQYKNAPWDDKQLVVDIRECLNQFDIITGWNSRMFDVRFLNTRLEFHGEVPLKKIKHVDLLYVARWKLKLASARLDNVCRFLQTKQEKYLSVGFPWIKAICGDKASLNEIVKHCEADVKVLEEVYNRLKHHVAVIHA